MGQSKRRKSLDPNYGKSKSFQDIAKVLITQGEKKAVFLVNTYEAKMLFEEDENYMYWWIPVSHRRIACLALTKEQYLENLPIIKSSYAVGFEARIKLSADPVGGHIPFEPTTPIVGCSLLEYEALRKQVPTSRIL